MHGSILKPQNNGKPRRAEGPARSSWRGQANVCVISDGEAGAYCTVGLVLFKLKNHPHGGWVPQSRERTPRSTMLSNKNNHSYREQQPVSQTAATGSSLANQKTANRICKFNKRISK